VWCIVFILVLNITAKKQQVKQKEFLSP